MEAPTPQARPTELSASVTAHRRRRLWLFVCQTVVLFGAAMLLFVPHSPGPSFDRSPKLEPICLCFGIALFFTTFYLFHVREHRLAWAALGTLILALLIAFASPAYVE
jgi:hypothetical protein